MAAKATKAELEETIRKARRELDRIESAECLAEMKPLIGRHFKYRNNYSMPKKASDYWWLYVKVIGTDGPALRTIEFQTTALGRMEINTRTRCHPARFAADAKSISKREFNAALKKMKDRIKRFAA